MSKRKGLRKIRKPNITGARFLEEESSSKLVAKPVAEVVANQEQSSSKLVAENPVKRESSSKLVAKPVAEVVANQEQSSSKLVAESSYFELSGLQKKLVEVVYTSCRENGSLISSPLSLSYLKDLLKTSSGTIKNATIRLQKKKILSKDDFKNGRGGWTKYRLNEPVYRDLLHSETGSKVVAKWKQTGSKVVAEPVAEPVASLSSSSSSYLNNNTTITRASDLPEDWTSISIPEFLVEKGFKPTHIKQVYLSQKDSLTSAEVQESLHEFSYDLENGLIKPFKGAVNLFLGVVRGKGTPWASEALAAREAAEIEKQIKAAEIKKQNKATQETLKNNAKIDLIFNSLSERAKKNLLEPDNKLKSFGSFAYEISLKGKIRELLEEKGEEHFKTAYEVVL